jgi:SRSO17 transposase
MRTTTLCLLAALAASACKTTRTPVRRSARRSCARPESWTQDPQRRSEARIPDAVQFKTKTDLALDMITRAVDAKIPGDIVLADSAYGDSNDSRETVRMFGLDYAVGVHAPTKVWCLDYSGRRRGDAIGVQQLGISPRPQRVPAYNLATWNRRKAVLAILPAAREGRSR